MNVGHQLIGLGTYGIKGNECVDIVSKAIEIGYRTIDTAQLYKNHTEIKLGIDLSGVNRSNIFIQSKISNKNISKLSICESICQIKSELGIEYIDSILLHNPVKNYVLAWEELIRCKEHTQIKNIGVSNFGIQDIVNIVKKTNVYPWLNQIELNIFNQQHDMIEYAKMNNIKIQSHTTLTNGKMLDHLDLKLWTNKLELTQNIHIPELMYKFVLDQSIGILSKTTNLTHLYDNFNLDKKPTIFTTEFLNEYQKELKKFNIGYKLYEYPK